MIAIPIRRRGIKGKNEISNNESKNRIRSM
jgi:hypothetical protein